MQKVIIIYAIVQLMSTAYGLAVIESIRPMVEKKLKDQGYIQNKNRSRDQPPGRLHCRPTS